VASDISDLPDLPSFQPRAFQRDQLGAGGDEQFSAMLRILDLQAQIPGVVRLRDWAMAALAPQPGETVVDVGSGTGSEVQTLARAVGPTGSAVGVEPNPQMRAEAERRAGQDGSLASFVDGDAVSLPFSDASVDAVRCERVFQHLPDPEAAAADMVRVLRPGGRVVLMDSDWGTAIWHPVDPAVARRHHESFLRHIAQPFAGRQLRSWLSRAGLTVDPDVGSTAVVMPDEALTGGAIVRSNAAAAVSDGSLSQDEADALVAGLTEAATRGEALVSVTMFAVLAHKFT
jgi:ubiquinone/menaquinone biosynthesis C-methylase UbiE